MKQTHENSKAVRRKWRVVANFISAAALTTTSLLFAAPPITAQQRKTTTGVNAPSPTPAPGATAATATTTTAAAPPPAAVAARRTGSIGGRVVDSANQPLGGVTVHARPAGEVVYPNPMRITVSDAEGQFRFDDLPAAAYTVTAMIPGYAAARQYEPNYAHLGENVTLTMGRGGVVTGRVTKSGGAPAIAVQVRVTQVRDAQGRAVRNLMYPFVSSKMTDDRGVYRVYGLAPGTYVASVNSGANFNPYETPDTGETTVYHPSATRDTAAEITVGEGQEVGGVDIQLRGERGHRVSGTVAGALGAPGTAGVNITLVAVENGMTESSTFIADVAGGDRSFELDNVADGEYEISARRSEFGPAASPAVVSPPRRVSVKGADVTGLALTLAPLASVSGRVVMPAAADECAKKNHAATFSEAVIQAQRAGREKAGEMWQLRRAAASATPDQQGDFTLRNLEAGRYRLRVTPPGDEWYVSAVSSPGGGGAATTSRRTTAAAAANRAAATNAAPAPPQLAAGEILVRAGQPAGGVTVTLAAGAARLRGRVAADEGASLPADVTVYLIPADAGNDDPLRYRAARLAAGGAFDLRHLAPGRYLLLALPIAPDADAGDATNTAWDAAERARLRRLAEAANNVVELPACAVTEHALRYSPTR